MNDSSKKIQLLALANINARISHLAESESAALERAHAAAWAAAGRHRAAEELLNGKSRKGRRWRGTSTGRTCVFNARSNF